MSKYLKLWEYIKEQSSDALKKAKKVIIHPLRNTASVSITFDDLKRFVEHYGHTYQLANVYKEEEK